MKCKKILIILIILILFLGLMVLLNYLSSPKYLMEKYMKAYNNDDCITIYNLTSEEKGEFINYQYFENTCKKNIKHIDNYNIHYYDKYAVVKNKKETKTIKYKKTGSKKYLFFDEYVIDNSIINIVKNVTLMVPNEALSVTIDNTPIGKMKNKTVDYVYKEYSLGNMYDLEYELKYTYNNKEYVTKINPKLEQNNIVAEFQNEPINVYIFMSETCRFCYDASGILVALEKEYGNYFKTIRYYIPDNEALMDRVVKHFNINPVGVPITIIGEDKIDGCSDDYYEKAIKMIMKTYRLQSNDLIKNNIIIN